jgi:predicted nucleic acid-binding protein
MRFWDSSALIPLLVMQAGSARADQWLGEDPELAIWTLTVVEVASALQRMVRDGAIPEGSGREVERRAEDLVQAAHVVVAVEQVKTQARRLLRLHPLRAADALQLAAALEWCGGRPSGRTFHTLDGRLATAARREGFEVVSE